MVLRLDPDRPVLWRSPSSLQIGALAPAAVIDDVAPGAERLLAALAGGISRSGYDMLARSAGIPADVAERLLTDLGPALRVDLPRRTPRVAVLGDTDLAHAVARMLPDGPADDPERADVVVLAADWVIAPADHARWLRRDIRHLPLVAVDGAVHIGPLVDPGTSPCLHCVHLARTDADPAWPAIATQLWGRAAAGTSGVLVAEAAARAVRLLVDDGPPEPPGVEWRVEESGRVSATTWSRHPGCSCAAPPGSDSGDAPGPAVRAAPRRAPVAAVPA